uniref:Uncharacterized protein n=1 Tax=Panagrolaimus sp. JU765 TaxID=591449 RepID=A0AC34R4X2_9BILA
MRDKSTAAVVGDNSRSVVVVEHIGVDVAVGKPVLVVREHKFVGDDRQPAVEAEDGRQLVVVVVVEDDRFVVEVEVCKSVGAVACRLVVVVGKNAVVVDELVDGADRRIVVVVGRVVGRVGEFAVGDDKHVEAEDGRQLVAVVVDDRFAVEAEVCKPVGAVACRFVVVVGRNAVVVDELADGADRRIVVVVGRVGEFAVGDDKHVGVVGGEPIVGVDELAVEADKRAVVVGGGLLVAVVDDGLLVAVVDGPIVVVDELVVLDGKHVVELLVCGFV